MDISYSYKRMKQWIYLVVEVVEVVLVQCNIADNQFQQKSEVPYTFTPKNC